jgi:hypothetical protein
MRIFGINEARYYCSSFSPYRGLSERRPWEFFKNQLGGTNQILREGSPSFSEWKSCSLRDVERCLFLAASHNRRFLDLLVASAAPWAHVTSYYGSFYSAQAILGLFGVTIFNKKVVDVRRSSLGQQELRVRTIGSGPGMQYSQYQARIVYYGIFFMPPWIRSNLKSRLNLHMVFHPSPQIQFGR